MKFQTWLGVTDVYRVKPWLIELESDIHVEKTFDQFAKPIS
jgi:hypothetical protein